MLAKLILYLVALLTQFKLQPQVIIISDLKKDAGEGFV